MSLNKYIVFEGTDGSGKTSISDAIYNWLPGPKVKTKEPGSPLVPLCVSIREEILHNASQSKDPLTYAYLFAADTKIHMERVVKPYLKDDAWVVSDRSVMSDYAYRPHDGDEIRQHNFENFIAQKPLVFFVDADPGVCGQRMQDRGNLNEFEKSHVIDKIVGIRGAYLTTAWTKFTRHVPADEGMWYNIDNNGKLEVAIMQTMAVIVGCFPELHYLLRVS